MATYTKEFLSENDGATIISSSASASPVVVHNSSTSNSIKDEVWIYASNSSSVDVETTVIIGLYNLQFKVTIPSKSGLTLVVPGLLIKGNGESPGPVWAYASTANVITLSGYVNRIS
jgi:hypothetical protein